MADRRRILSAEELDAMTPHQRAAAVRERIVTNPDELPEELRRRVFETTRRLATERNAAP